MGRLSIEGKDRVTVEKLTADPICHSQGLNGVCESDQCEIGYGQKAIANDLLVSPASDASVRDWRQLDRWHGDVNIAHEKGRLFQ